MRSISSISRDPGGDVVIFGTQAASVNPGQTSAFSSSYLHNGQSLQQLWDEVGQLTGTAWRVDVEAIDELQEGSAGPDLRSMRYGIYRV